jgi:hypothetical protein
MAKTRDMKSVEVTVMVYANGVLVDSHTNKEVPAYAVDYVAQAAVIQVEDPDLEAAEDAEKARDD